MSRKKISTTIYVTPEQNDWLKLLHERTKVPVAVYIREGIDLVLRQYEHLLPGQLALEVSGNEEGRPRTEPTPTPPPTSVVPIARTPNRGEGAGMSAASAAGAASQMMSGAKK